MDNYLKLKERVEKALNSNAADNREVIPETEALISDLWNEINILKSAGFNTKCESTSCLLSEAFYAIFDGIGLNYHHNINLIISLLGQYCGADFVTYNKLKDGQLTNAGKWALHPHELDKFDPVGKICYDLIQYENPEAKFFSDLDKSTVYNPIKNVSLPVIKSAIGMVISSQGSVAGAVLVFYKDNREIDQHFRILIKLFSSLLAMEELRTLSLSETEEKLHILINATPDIICFKDGQGRWLQANNSMLKAFSLQNIDYTMKSEAELSLLTKPIYKEAFNNCSKSDHLAWETGGLSHTEECIPGIDGKKRVYDVIKVPLYNEDKSRKGLVVFGRDITQRILAQQQTTFLNQSALGFLQMEDNDNIYEYIASKIYHLLGEEGIVMVASFDESLQVATLRTLVGIGASMGRVLKLIQSNPVGMTTYLNEERKKHVMEPSFTIQNSIYEMLSGALNPLVCKKLEQLLNIGKIYEIGFSNRNWLLGDVTILLPKGVELVNRDAIEALVKMSAVALYQKQAKLSLMESEESYRGLFNCMNSAVYVMADDAKFLDVNEGALKMYGYPRERFIGNTPDFLSAPGKNDNINIPEILEKTFNGEPQQIEYWGIKKDGTVFPKDIKFYKGRYFGQGVVLAVADDITERYNMISQIIEARDETERNLQKTQSIVTAFPDLILVINEEGDLIEALSGNEEYATFFSSKKNLTHINEFVPNSLVNRVYENIRKVLYTEEMQVFDVNIQTEDFNGSFEVRMVKYKSNQILAVVRDITRQDELIQELSLAKDKAEESGRLKTAFLHNISHEIRTPLNGIVGFSNLLTQPGIVQGDISEYVSFINSCSDQLLSIINDIVSVATLEAGQEKVVESSIDLNKMLSRVQKQFAMKADSKGLELSLIAGLPDDNCLIITDETKLIQLLSNLIGNSIKFTKEGNIKYGYRVDGDFIEFFVQDTGVGIPKNMHEIIFDRFHQVNNTLSLNTGGTGLGLSISKSYVELMGGRIWVKSIPDEQTIFFFTIPYKTTSGNFTESEQSAAKKGEEFLRDKVILVAEDEEVNFRLIKGILAGTGAKLIHVYNGEDAVEKFRNGTAIDLVLMDLKMSVMDGFTAANLIRQMLPKVPIIAQSALALSGDRQRAIEAGCTDYISKPLRKMKLLEIIEKYLTSGSKNI